MFDSNVRGKILFRLMVWECRKGMGVMAPDGERCRRHRGEPPK